MKRCFATDFAAMGENRVVRALKILVDRVTEKQSCVVRFMEVTRLCRRVLYPSDSFEGALQKILFFMRCFGKWSMGIILGAIGYGSVPLL